MLVRRCDLCAVPNLAKLLFVNFRNRVLGCGQHAVFGVSMTMRVETPKGTDLSGYSQNELHPIADEMNVRPRKTFDGAASLEVYGGWLARLNVQPEAI